MVLSMFVSRARVLAFTNRVSVNAVILAPETLQ